MATLKDLYEFLDRNEAKLVVYRKLTSYLQNTFLPTDALPPEESLVLDDGRSIPNDLVEEIIDELRNQHIVILEERIRKLMYTEIDDTMDKLREARKAEHEEDETKPAKLPRKKKAAQ